MSAIRIYSSWNPSKEAFDRQWDCLLSWVKHGFEVCLLQNRADEKCSSIANLRNSDWTLLGGRLTIFFVDDPGKIPLSTFAQVIAEHGMLDEFGTFYGIMNSDIEISEPIAVDLPLHHALYEKFLHTSVDIIGLHRYNDQREEFWQGYDAFFFRKGVAGDLLQHQMLKSLHLGDPWWDYAVPLLAIGDGAKGHLLRGDWLYHKDHEIRWDEWVWHANGLLTATMLAEQAVNKPIDNGYFASLAWYYASTEFARQFAEEKTARVVFSMEFCRVFSLICASILKAAFELPLQEEQKQPDKDGFVAF